MFFYAYCIYRSLVNTLYIKHQCIHYYYCSPLHNHLYRSKYNKGNLSEINFYWWMHWYVYMYVITFFSLSFLKRTVSADVMMIYILHKKFPTEIKERQLINPILTVLLYILTLKQHIFFFFLHSHAVLLKNTLNPKLDLKN